MALNDILFAITGSQVGNTFTLHLPISGSQGSPIFIEAQTVFFEKKLIRNDVISIF
jgi:hypothetical protein